MIEWDDEPLTDEQAAKMSDEELSARIEKTQARMVELRRLEELALQALAKKDPELAAEMRKQKRR